VSSHIEQLPDGEFVLVDDGTGSSTAIDVTPVDPTAPGSGVPGLAGTGTGIVDTAGKQGGTAAFDLSALKWLGALVLLWVILTALTEFSPNTQMFGQALAGLILLAALFYLGPAAIGNVKNLWGGSTPTTGG
jgi:hypothetical protein